MDRDIRKGMKAGLANRVSMWVSLAAEHCPAGSPGGTGGRFTGPGGEHCGGVGGGSGLKRSPLRPGTPINSNGFINKMRGEYLWMSDSAAFDVEFDGEIYPTGEHAFQAAKTQDPAKREYIRNAKTVGLAMAAGHGRASSGGVKIPDEMKVTKEEYDAFSKNQVEVREQILRSKFDRHPGLKKLLVDTGDDVIVEGPLGSRKPVGTEANLAGWEPRGIWMAHPDGSKGDLQGKGEFNQFGEVMTKLRTEYKNDPSVSRINDKLVKDTLDSTKLYGRGRKAQEQSIDPTPRDGVVTGIDSAAKKLSAGESNKVVPAVARAWLKEKGFDVGDRGRLSQEMVDTYTSLKSKTPADIRQWAIENGVGGVKEGSRGRIPKSVLDEYYKGSIVPVTSRPITPTPRDETPTSDNPNIPKKVRGVEGYTKPGDNSYLIEKPWPRTRESRKDLVNTNPSRSEALKRAKSLVDGFNDYDNSLTSDERSAIDGYIGGRNVNGRNVTFEALNSNIRRVGGDVSKIRDPEMRKWAEDLTSAVDKAPTLSEPVTLYRGMVLPKRDRERIRLEADHGKRQEMVRGIVERQFGNGVRVAENITVASSSIVPHVAARFTKKVLTNNRLNLDGTPRLSKGGFQETDRWNGYHEGGFILEIEARKGAYIAPRGVDLLNDRDFGNKTSGFSYKEQEEVLLPARSKFEVMEIADGVYNPIKGKTDNRRYTVVKVRQLVEGESIAGPASGSGSRRVKTPEGAKRYGKPIGAVIAAVEPEEEQLPRYNEDEYIDTHENHIDDMELVEYWDPDTLV